jgi:hypothetical protein
LIRNGKRYFLPSPRTAYDAIEGPPLS